MFASWVRVISRNNVYDISFILLAKKRHPEEPKVRLARPENTVNNAKRCGLSPSEEFANKECIEAAKSAFETKLDLESRKIIELYFDEGMTLQEIGRQLELSYDQGRYQFHESIQKLSFLLERS